MFPNGYAFPAVARDLTDREAARELGKHVRTVQRWCRAGDLPGARKVGRSWRIPAAAIRARRAAAAGGRDDVERELRAATLACQALRTELEQTKARGRPAVGRNWRRVARELEALHAALAGLPSSPSQVPAWVDAATWGRPPR